MTGRTRSGREARGLNAGVTWPLPPRELALGGDDVHVWCAAADVAAGRRDVLGQTLSADERARAERFVFPRDRDRFVVRRGLLRIILGRYLSLAPDRLRFDYGTRGKPAVAPGQGGARLCFNVSSSAGLVLYAVARGREIGVDLERIRRTGAEERIPEHFFSPREVATLRGLPPESQREAFFSCWTRKEAYVKGTGAGLALGLDRFDVSLAPGEPAALLRTADDAGEAARWALQAVAPGRGYVGAVAVEGRPRRLECWHWTE